VYKSYRCQRFTTSQLKRPILGSKKKAKGIPKGSLVWRTGLSGVPPDSVRCTRGPRAELLSLGNFQRRRAIIHRTCPVYTGQCPVLQDDVAPELGSLGKLQRLLRYNSPDMSGVTTGQRLLRRQRLPADALNARQRAQKSGKPMLAHRTLYSACPVRHRTSRRAQRQESNGRIPTVLVTWLAHRICQVCTGLSGAPCDRQPHQTASLVVGAINTPTTHHSLHPSFPLLKHLQELGIQF
jgi:hypothetical protein